MNLRCAALIVLGCAVGAQAATHADSTRALLEYQPLDSIHAVVHSITILGNRRTTAGTILREFTFHAGDSVTGAELTESQQRVYNLGLFNSVDIAATRDSASNTIDVFLFVSERWYVWPQVILGVKDRDYEHMFSRGSKLFAGLGIMHFNVRGRREKLFVGGVLGYDPYASVEYDFLTLDSARSFFLDASLGTSRTLNQSDTLYTNGYGFNEVRYNGAAEVTWRATPRLNLTAHVEVQSLHLSNPAARLTLDPSGTDIAPTVSLIAAYDSRDNAEYATDGAWLAAKISKTGAGTYINFGDAAVDLRAYVPLGAGIALCGRAAASAVYGGNVPLYDHAFLGLTERVRGAFTVKREGENFALGSIEARFPIFAPRTVTWTGAPRWFPDQFATGRLGLYATLFADAGNVWFRNDNPAAQQWLSGAGAGLNILFSYALVFRLEYAVHGAINNGEVIFDLGASL